MSSLKTSARTAHANLDAPVLRHPFLGDVEIAQNLDARNDRRLKPLDRGRHRHLLQQPIHAIADAQLMLKGLDAFDDISLRRLGQG